ncbi:glutamate ABC transporter substrate-binding protein [Nocardioidaceae bacterium SCSIO 66511]|nr:glutamate ABC transporter substrate-binding protein [Nocardioidaceae bacterium SCSIO 66511]
MRLKRTAFAVVAASMLVAVSACGDAGDDDEGGSAPKAEVEENAADNFDDGTAMKQLAEDGSVTIGVKIDQPGIGFQGATDDIPSGFDIEVGKWLAADLGIKPEDVEWKETISDNRERFIEDEEVDLVIASYSITPERRAVVGQAGPYYVTGQQLMVQKDNDEIETVDDVKGKEVCSVTGSTSLDQVEAKGAEPRGFDTYSQCRDQVKDGTVDAMTTDGSILLGYVAEDPDLLKVVGPEFSEERYGIGYAKDSPEMCTWITDLVQEKMDNGDWAKAFEATLGQSGVETPEPPKMDACKSA